MEGCLADAPALSAISTCKLSSGHSIPMVGLGTWKADKENEVGNAVKWALEAGYIHLDCASCYGVRTCHGM